MKQSGFTSLFLAFNKLKKYNFELISRFAISGFSPLDFCTELTMDGFCLIVCAIYIVL